MYEVWETGAPARRLAEAGTFAEAAQQLEDECRRRYAQAAVNGEGTRGMRYRFEVRDGAGQTAAMLVWAPDCTQPYESLLGVAADEEIL